MPDTILIVDDEPHMRRVIELTLNKGGYHLLAARNGLEAVEKAVHQLPTLIVMDVTMPEMDGLEALQRLKLNPTTSKIPVIMLTARGQMFPREQAEGSGAALYLTKPFSPTQLLTEVRRILAELSAPS